MLFIALVQVPSIGMHKWTSFSVNTYAVNAKNEKEALKIISGILGPKDPTVQEALKEQDGYKDGEYFSVWLHQVPSGQKIVYIHEPSSGFNKPYKDFKL